jgi:hypothetical protein
MVTERRKSRRWVEISDGAPMRAQRDQKVPNSLLSIG